MKSLSRIVPVLLLVVVAASIAATIPAYASDARTDALGVQREYLEDYVLFRSFPTVAARYANLVTASLGNRYSQNRSVGVIGSGEGTNYGVFAIYLNDLGMEDRQDAQVDLTWAKQLSGAAVGASVNWTKSSQKTGDVEMSPIFPAYSEFNQLSLIGGVKLDVSDQTQLEAAAELAFLTYRDDASGAQDDGKPSYRLSARLMKEASEKTTLVPLVQYTHVDYTAKDSPDKTADDSFNLGVAAHHQVNGDDLLILGIAANYLKREGYFGTSGTHVKDSRWDMPALFIALEFGVYDWLTARVGATKTLDVETYELTSNGNSTDFLRSHYYFGLGMGLHFDHFDVDATVNPNAVFTGGYLFSGESSTPLTLVTGTYYF